MAAEDFNISLGLDTSGADKELASFVANARKQARELRKELASIKAPKLKIGSDVSSALSEVDKLTKKIERLKKSMGASTKEPMAKVKAGEWKTAEKQMQRISDRMANLKISLGQLSKITNPGPAAIASIADVKSEMKKLEGQKKLVLNNARAQAAELRKTQAELAAQYADPKVFAAMKKQKDAVKAHNDVVAKANAEKSRVMQEIEKLERGPEVIKAMKDQVSGLKEMRVRASKLAADTRKELAAAKAELAGSKTDSKGKNNRSVIQAKVDSAAKKLKTLHEYILWASDEIETLADAGPRTKGLKGITKKMGIKPAYGGDTGVRGEVPAIRSTTPLNTKDYQKIVVEATKLAKQSIEIGIARGVKSASETRPNKQTTGGIAPNLMIAAARQLFPDKISADVAGAASRGEGGIGVILRDTKADIGKMLSELSDQEEAAGSDVELISTISDLKNSMVDLKDQMGDEGSNQTRGGRKLSTSEAAVQSEMVKGGGGEAVGSIVTASEDLSRNIRDANNHTRELLTAFSAGDDQFKPGGVSDRRGGFFPVASENALGMDDDAALKFATLTADEYELLTDVVIKASQQIQAAAGKGGSAELKFSGAPILSNRTNQGMFWSGESRSATAERQGRDAELDSREEDAKSGGLKLVPIGLGTQDKELEAAIDRGFQKFLQEYLKLESKPSVGVKDIMGPLGTYASAAPGSEAASIIAALQKADASVSTDRNFVEIDKAIGASSPFASLIKTLIAKVTAGVSNPVLESTGMSGDLATFQYQALSNNDTAGAMNAVGSIQEDFISMVQYLAILYDKAGLKVKPGITRGSYGDIADSSTTGTQADPYMDSYLRMFNAATNPGKQEIPAYDASGARLRGQDGSPISGEIESPLNNFVETLTPFTRVLKDLSVTFKDIYKIPMADNLGKKGKFNELGLPDANGVEKTYGEAFTQNRKGFIADMLRASAPMVQAPGTKKDATDKAGGAEVPIDAIDNIFEKLSTIGEQFFGGPSALTGIMDNGQNAEVNNQLLEAMVKTFTQSRQSQEQRLIGMGISPAGSQPAAQDAIRAKYGETVNGLSAGLAPGVAKAEKAGADTAIAFIDGYEGKMEIQSPSKRMKKSGDNTIAGLEQGLFDGVARLDKSGRQLADSFHTGWSEEARVNAVELIQQLEKEGTDVAKQRIANGLKMMRSAPPAKPVSDLPSMQSEAERKRLAEIGAAATAAKGGSKPPASFALSSQEEIQRRNAANLAQLDRIRQEGQDLLVALDVETTGGRNADHPRGGMRNRVFGYSAVAGNGELMRDEGRLPGAPVITPRMTGISHGMVVPPKDNGQLFSGHVAGVLGLQGPDGTNKDVLQNLIKRIGSLGYGKQNTTGSEQEYVNQLEDIAELLKKLYEEKIPLAIHNQGLSDLGALGKEFAHYGISAPTGAQFRDEGLLVETQSMGKMLGGYMKDFSGKISLSVGKIYELFTGKSMGAELIPPAGNIPKLADASAVAHDPTIDTAGTLVNAYTMRNAAGQAGVSQTGLLGKSVQMLDATWQKVSDAIWGSRKFGSPGQAGNVPGFTAGGPKELEMWKRQSATHGGQLQPVYGPQQASMPAPAVVTPQPAQDPQQAAQEAGDAAARQAKAIDALEKEKARIRKLKAQAEFQYQVDLVEQDMSVLKNLQAELNKPINQGEVQKTQLLKDMAKLQATIDSKLKASSELADGIRRQLDANGGVRTLFRAQKTNVGKSDTQKQLEKQVKDAQKEIDAQLGTQAEAKPKASRGGSSVIAAPLAQLQAAEQRIQASLTNAVSNSLGPALVSRLEQELAYVQKSIKTGPVGKRRVRDAGGNLTSAEVDVFKAEGVRGAKERVAGKTQVGNIRKGLLAELKAAEEKGRTETVAEVSKLIDELDKSLASGPVGRFKNGRDAFELPDSYRQKSKQEKVVISNVGDAQTPGAYDNMTHKNWIDQELEGEAKARKAASEQIKGQMKGEISVMADVEKYNRKMMDSWISGRYALYDVANTYQQFQRVLMTVGREFQKAVQTFAAFETSFTSVERAMQPLPDEFAGMRNEIVKLTGELPVAFDELSKITTLGAQMGIKADGITDFTEQVTKFSTITGLASDTVAQKFGRISQLAKVPSEDFNKLGSAVAFAGVNAVATDEEILTLTENIAAAASNSGFTADKIIGLATAMSSLGIAPEQARGVITRLFGDINRAVEGGGAPLNAFAKQLGMSAEGAKELWKSDPQMFFKQMLDGLSGSKNMTAALDALNIKETREVSTLQKLAGNMEVYNQAMSDAQESYANGSFLSDAYGKTQDNLATKLELLNNQLKMLQDSFGQALAPTLGVVVGWMTDLLAGINKISQNPMAKWAMNIVTALGALVAIMVTYRMVSMKATASLLAFRTAQVSLSKIGGQEAGIGGFAKMLMGQEQLIIRSNGRIEVASKKRIKQMQALGEINVAERGSAEDIALRSGVDARRAGLSSTDDIIAGKSGMRQATLDSNEDTMATLENTAAKDANAQATSRNAAASVSESESKSVASGAIRQEVAAINQEISTRQRKIVLLESEIAVKQASIAAGKGDILGSQQAVVANQAEIATIQGEIAAYEAKQAALTKSNAKTGETVSLMSAGETVANRFGGALTKLTFAAGAISLVLMGVSAIASYIESLQINLEEAGGGLASFREAIYKDTTAWREGADAISTYSSNVTTTKTELADWAVGLQAATGSQSDLTDSVSQTTDEVTKQTLALGANATQWLANAAMQDDVIQNMFKDYFNNGRDLGALSKTAGVEIASMVQAALALPGTGAAEYVEKMFNVLALDPNISGKVKNDLLNLASALDATTLAGVQNSKVQNTLIGSFGATDDAVTDLNNNLDNTIEKIYTLTDYVSDFGSLLSAAFTIRYGSTEAIDKLATSWRSVGDRLSEAKKQMQAINQEISAMTADRNILEYQLSIALKYGDTLRADKIRAEIEAKSKEISDSQAEYGKAAQEASTRLTGMSPGAIANRETMRSMVQDYNSRMTAYANEYTASTNKVDRARIKAEADRLKADFIAKAQSLGFAKNELAPYIKSFGDLKTIVNKLPNTLTLKVNADPGMRAWLEWWAKNKNGAGTAVVSTDNPGGTPGGTPAGNPGVVTGTGDVPIVPTTPTPVQSVKKATAKMVSKDTGIMKNLQPSNFRSAVEKDFNAFRNDYAEIKNNYGGAFTEQAADRKFGGDATKMAKWRTIFKRYQNAEKNMYGWNINVEDAKAAIDVGGKNTKYSSSFESTTQGMQLQDSANAKATLANSMSKLSAPLRSAIKWMISSGSQYTSDKAAYESYKTSWANAKKAMGLDENKTWAQILKENGPNGTGLKTHLNPATGEEVKIVDYLEPFRNKFSTMWNTLINNAKTGKKYREVLRQYDKSFIAQYFPGGIGGDTSWYDETTVPKSAGDVRGYASGGLIPGNAPANKKLDNMFASSPNGMIAVRSGEYIQSQQAVKYYGVDFMNAVNKMQMPRLTYATQSSGSANGNNIVVELSPNAVMQLMAMSNRPINLYSDDRQIASSANRGNRLLAMRGSN